LKNFSNPAVAVTDNEGLKYDDKGLEAPGRRNSGKQLS
jgi:hypothetical protein